MARRVPPVIDVPDRLLAAITAAVRFHALQHQDELTAFLDWAVDRLDRLQGQPPRVIVEIGSHQGGTLACWAEIATDLVVGIDLPVGAGGPSEWGGILPEMIAPRDAALTTYYPHLRTILGNSRHADTLHTLQYLLGTRAIDLLFIDGDHTLDGVESDYRLYSPLVRPGGIIAFHDVNPCIRAVQQNFAVPDFFEGFQQSKWIFTVNAEWGGIGAIIKPFPAPL